MDHPSSPQTWDDWFRAGTIYEPEFFHGLIYCARTQPLPKVMSVLRNGESERFEEMLRKLVSIADIVGDQCVTSVARYDLNDARGVLESLDAERSAQ